MCTVMLSLIQSPGHLQGEGLEKIDVLFSKPWLDRVDLFYYLKYVYLCSVAMTTLN